MAKKKVLIVEDEHNIAQAQALILQDNFDIYIASDGERGLELAKKLRPDLIVLDLMLPKRGGYDLCFNVRQDKSIKATKILMVTAKVLDTDKEKGVLVGADDYLTKPFDPDDLLKRAINLTRQ